MKKAAKRAVVKKARPIERIPTGVRGLDKFMEGGLIKGSTTLLTGSTGTGKTIFCAQYVMEGLKKGEKCVFITTEETVKDIENDMKSFRWDMSKYVDSKQLALEFYDPFQLADAGSKLAERIRRNGVQRVVIDSTALFGLYFKDAFEVRKSLFDLLTNIKSSGATTIITSEMPEGNGKLSRFGVEEFLTDNVIILHYLGLGESIYHSIQIRKMRRTDHGKDVYPMDITKEGIVLKKTAIS